jgi:hypothetical protein
VLESIDPVDVVLEFAIYEVHATLPDSGLYLPSGHAAQIDVLVVESMLMNPYPALHWHAADLSCICSSWPVLVGQAVQGADPLVGLY